MLDNPLQTIQKTQRSIEMAVERPTTEKLVQQVQVAAKKSLESVLPLKTSVSTLQAKIKEKAPQ